MDKNYSIEKSKDGYKILKIDENNRTLYIGSKYNEEREIEKVIKFAGDITENDNYIIFGLATANHIDKLREKKFENSKILIVEVEEKWIELFEGNEELSKKIKEDTFIVKSNQCIEEFFSNYINEQNISHLKIIPYCNYDKHYTQELVKPYKVIKEEIESIIVNRNTKNHFSELWFKSRMRNIRYLPVSNSILEYKNIHNNNPAIIVSAGPSLSRNIDKLKEINNAIIISGGRTLKSLINIGVNPDYTVVIDPSDKSYELVEGYINKVDTKLVYHTGTPYKILEEHNGEKIITSEEAIFEEILGEKIDHVKVGGSVAHSMTKLAVILGCNPIIFIGQDFAYTNDVGHASIAASPWETIDLDNYKSDTDIWVKDIEGNLVRTSKILNYYRLQMENIIESNNQIKFINASEGGANIKGTEVLKLNDINIDGEYPEIFREKKAVILKEDVKLRLNEKMVESYSAMKKSVGLYRKGIKLLEKYNKNIKCGLTNNIIVERELDKIDNEILNINEKIIFIHELVYPIIDQISTKNEYIINKNDNHKSKLEKVIAKNLYLYREVHNVLKMAIKEMELTIKSIGIEEI